MLLINIVAMLKEILSNIGFLIWLYYSYRPDTRLFHRQAKAVQKCSIHFCAGVPASPKGENTAVSPLESPRRPTQRKTLINTKRSL